MDEVCLDVCLHHHERIDGNGYPHKLKGEELSLFATMGAICDVYDAITSNRSYKSGWEPTISLKKMSKWQGHFDPVLLKAFIKCLGIYPNGSLVKLKSGRLAVVLEQNANNLLKPKVKVFFSTRSNGYIPSEIIELSQSQEEIISYEDPKAWSIRDFKHLWAQT